jgi:hypothetical protein
VYFDVRSWPSCGELTHRQPALDRCQMPWSDNNKSGQQPASRSL